MPNKKSIIFPLLLVCYEIATYLSNDMYLPALPLLAEEFNTTDSIAQLTLTAWFFGFASLHLLLGPLSDRFGRKPTLLLGGLVYLISTIMCATAPTINILIAARFMQGASTSSVIIAGYASVHELYDQKKVIRLLSIMGSITIFAPAFGPLLGSFVLHNFTWRIIYWILFFWAGAALLSLTKFMPESNPNGKVDHPLKFKRVLKSYLSLIKNLPFMLNTLAYCLIFTGLITWIAAGPFVVMSEYHYSATMFGVVQAMIFGGFILGNKAIRYLIEKVSLTYLINLGLLISLSGALLSLLFTLLMPQQLMAMIIPLILFTLGIGLAFVPLQRLTIESSDEPMGSKMAIFSSIMSGFAVIATVLVGVMYKGNAICVVSIILGAVILAGTVQVLKNPITRLLNISLALRTAEHGT